MAIMAFIVTMKSMEILVSMEIMVFADNYGFYGNYQNCGKSGKSGNYKAPVWASGSPLICPNRSHIWGELFI